MHYRLRNIDNVVLMLYSQAYNSLYIIDLQGTNVALTGQRSTQLLEPLKELHKLVLLLNNAQEEQFLVSRDKKLNPLRGIQQ